jgi:hypothetical protein
MGRGDHRGKIILCCEGGDANQRSKYRGDWNSQFFPSTIEDHNERAFLFCGDRRSASRFAEEIDARFSWGFCWSVVIRGIVSSSEAFGKNGLCDAEISARSGATPQRWSADF